jgi:hypothetical protein
LHCCFSLYGSARQVDIPAFGRDHGAVPLRPPVRLKRASLQILPAKYPLTNKDREIGSDGREHGIHDRSQWTQPVHENERYETDDEE